MKKVAHGIDEDYFGLAPAQGFGQFFGYKAQIETLFVWMALHGAEAFGKSFGVAVFTTWADFGAAADGIPGGVGPFNVRCN